MELPKVVPKIIFTANLYNYTRDELQ